MGYQTGDHLPNGAIVIDTRESGDVGVVLAKFAGSPQPWVTWRFPAGDPGATWSGHYHEDIEEAVNDFLARSLA